MLIQLPHSLAHNEIADLPVVLAEHSDGVIDDLEVAALCEKRGEVSAIRPTATSSIVKFSKISVGGQVWLRSADSSPVSSR